MSRHWGECSHFFGELSDLELIDRLKSNGPPYLLGVDEKAPRPGDTFSVGEFRFCVLRVISFEEMHELGAKNLVPGLTYFEATTD